MVRVRVRVRVTLTTLVLEALLDSRVRVRIPLTQRLEHLRGRSKVRGVVG